MFPKGKLRYFQVYEQKCVGVISCLRDGLFIFKDITSVGTTKACQDISIMHPNRLIYSFCVNTFTRSKPLFTRSKPLFTRSKPLLLEANLCLLKANLFLLEANLFLLWLDSVELDTLVRFRNI